MENRETRLDRDTIQTLYERHGPALLAYAVSLVHYRHAAEDVLHEVFVKLLRRSVVVTGAHVVRSVPELDQAAIDTVLQWQFEATSIDGEPVEVEMNIVVNFTLR